MVQGLGAKAGLTSRVHVGPGRATRSGSRKRSNRFYYWRTPSRADIAKDSIIVHSANTHVIPQNSLVRKQLSRLRAGRVAAGFTPELRSGQDVDRLHRFRLLIESYYLRHWPLQRYAQRRRC